MGERLRWVISVDEHTQRLADRWQEQFAPLVGANRSSLVRLVFKTLDRLGMTGANVLAALNQPQGLTEAIAEQSVAQCHTSSQQFPAAIQAGPLEAGEGAKVGAKPPRRVTAPSRPLNRLIRREAVEMAWLPPFAFNSTPLRRSA